MIFIDIVLVIVLVVNVVGVISSIKNGSFSKDYRSDRV